MTGRFRFRDLVSDRVCVLVVPEGGAVFPREGQPKIGVEHPGCGMVADLAIKMAASALTFRPVVKAAGPVPGRRRRPAL